LFGDLKKTAIPLAEAGGRIAAEALVPYPPGIALVWPGEIITADRIAAIKRFLAAGITVYGVHDPDSDSVVVLK
jgi:arginine/lysine/ornithine decarboxylase